MINDRDIVGNLHIFSYFVTVVTVTAVTKLYKQIGYTSLFVKRLFPLSLNFRW